MSSSKNNYDVFAEVYRRNWAGFSTRVMPLLENQILSKLEPESRIVDLCCGTGEMVKELTKRGYQVIGIDNSSEMIRIAQENEPKGGFYVRNARNFSRQDIVAEAVISHFDSLNHILELWELNEVFENVYSTLQTGGYFFFDMNTEEAHQRWNSTFHISDEEYVCINKGTYLSEERLAVNDLTIFKKEEGDLWHRADCQLLQRNYLPEQIISLLKGVGFGEVEEVDSSNYGFKPESGRVFFKAKKI
ncbi:class I SAM-dependent DNA methyltransferase [Risungbinella massiliensis]|uniref:class I SAM-dependent DNA methyltransferase n=1 Tax=Risungbinella massiliensis TaxID=1329796 RepID=UPI0005CBD345|nr:class I SAM-dependent methyltransferase [Risungbinella massiliensis]